ncbi:hypothetical protein ACLMJK_002588 [Lecanora helva]
MATLSPTPYSFNETSTKPSHRQFLNSQPSRPYLKRGGPVISKPANNESGLPKAWNFSMGDSSDDEAPIPPSMKFSAEVKAILGDEASFVGTSLSSEKDGSQRVGATEENVEPSKRPSLLSLSGRQRERTASAASSRSGSPRIVRLKAITPGQSTLRKATSPSTESTSPQPHNQRDYVTPLPRPRSPSSQPPYTNSVINSSNSHGAVTAKASSAGSQDLDEPRTDSRDHSSIRDTAAQMSNLSIGRAKGEETGVQGSLRVKKVGKVTGRYLSGPARRGMKRRQSEESPMHEGALPSEDQASSVGARAVSPQAEASSISPNLPGKSETQNKSPHPERPHQVRFQSQVSTITGSPVQAKKEPQRSLLDASENQPKPRSSMKQDKSPERFVQPVFKVPPLPLLPSRYDQENEPPPTFKRNKVNSSGLSENAKFSIMSDEKMLVNTPATATPQRPALAARSQNTPHRPAPAPPKMSVLETATAPAGAASASQARKKRNYISVNGKLFTRMDCIGRGGSSKVYRVMAENYKVFALKRVTLEDQDELAVRGYKGEIDLLKKLENVDRVVRLFDWELNTERQTLSVLMEMGETDLNRVLTQRLNSDEASLDVTFTRYFWKEMLECVQAVHRHDIVHSDLKPANFLLLQGKLKLIDFGIANAIETDSTVNVHREQHIGTPNYMSPEALIDSNASSGLPSTAGKMMKLGKPSDIWSLGCILYQMTYSKPPFAHIANQMQRIMAIPNPSHVISFPETGVGGVTVPAGLLRTLKSCLNRNSLQRPTVEQLLSTTDPFLNPDSAIRDTVPVGQELIARLQHNIIKHIREKGMPSDVELATWPARFFASIKIAVEEGRA